MQRWLTYQHVRLSEQEDDEEELLDPGDPVHAGDGQQEEAGQGHTTWSSRSSQCSNVIFSVTDNPDVVIMMVNNDPVVSGQSFAQQVTRELKS